MAHVIYFLTVLMYLAQMVTSSYYVSSQKMDFYKAMETCHQRGESWRLIDDQSFTNMMADKKLEAVWIAILRKEVFWQWVNEEPYDDFDEEPSHHRCALLTFDGKVLSSTCVAQRAGYACQMKAHLSCPKDSCLPLNETKVFIDCSSVDWYTSRQICREHQGDLLHIKDTSMYQTVANFMKQETKCQQVFIGLYRDKWHQVIPESDGKVIFQTRWDKDQPAYSMGRRCVEMHLNSRAEVVWSTQSCSSTNYFICTDGKSGDDFIVEETKVTPKIKPANKSTPMVTRCTEQLRTTILCGAFYIFYILFLSQQLLEFPI